MRYIAREIYYLIQQVNPVDQIGTVKRTV
jgi:hypothetical protein